MESGKFLVFFDWDKYNLTPEARRVVASAFDNWKKTGNARIVATGYTDLSGTAAYNQKLSERRAASVAQELVRLGVPSTNITTIGKGESIRWSRPRTACVNRRTAGSRSSFRSRRVPSRPRRRGRLRLRSPRRRRPRRR